MDASFSPIRTGLAQTNQATPKKKAPTTQSQQNQGTQMSSQTSSAFAAYGLAQIRRPAAPVQTAQVAQTQAVQDKPDDSPQSQPKVLNLFYFSDTHGELSGLTKVGVAARACQEMAGGKDHMTVLGAGDLVAGSQADVISATVGVVNELGMEATSLGNHERSRSDAKLSKLNSDMQAQILAINATPSEQSTCAITASKICRQGDTEFIAIGAQPISSVDDPKEIATAIDSEVERIRQERHDQGLSEDLPVVFLSHMGSNADKAVAENSQYVSVILGGHTHNIEEHDYTGAAGQQVHVVQGGKNNELATVVRMEIADDGTITTTSKKIGLKEDEESIVGQVEEFYGDTSQTEQVLNAALETESTVAKTVEASVGPKIEIAEVKQGYGYTIQPEANGLIRERNYSNPVANIMADGMLAATRDQGAQVALFNAPSVKDTEIPEGSLSNYDIISRMLPFGGKTVTVDLPVERLYDVVEEFAQAVATEDDCEMIQVGGMAYSVDVEKAQARFAAHEEVKRAQKALTAAEKTGGDTTAEQAALDAAKAAYDELPRCVGKILIEQQDGSEIKINPKAVQRGDFAGQTIRCATNDFFAGVILGIPEEEQTSGPQLSEVFRAQMETVRDQNDGEFFVDQNDVRISLNDPNGAVNGYATPRSLNTGHWT